MYLKVENPIPEELKRLALLFKQAGYPLYAVGGSIRNTLLHIPVTDTDICSAMRPDEVMELCRQNSIAVVPKGISFGTVEIHIGDKAFEHTAFRSDSYFEGGAHRPASVRFSSSLFEDAFRRDFTVNALYADILTGEIFDPAGGAEDLKNRLLRAVSKNPETTLRDDGLRIMRLIRFASELSFEIEDGTFNAAKTLVNNLKDISGERLRDELNKILLCDIKYGGFNREKVLRALELFRDTGALAVVLPELYSGRGITRNGEHHKYDILNHALHTAAECKPNLSLRLAGLLHDVGKPYALKKTGKMLHHEIESVNISQEILYKLRYDNKTIDEVAFLIGNHTCDINDAAKESVLRKTFVRWGYERSLAAAELREADMRSSGIITGGVEAAERRRKLLEKMRCEGVPFSEAELNCTGEDIMTWLSLKPGKRVGEIKRALLMRCAVYPQDNNKEKLREISETLCKAQKNP